jgi:TonB-linked SusC/RagA family outer membrane protein
MIHPSRSHELSTFHFGGIMTLRRVLSLFTLAFLVFPALALAQGTATIRGRVTDAANGSPLAGAQVRIEGTTIGTQTGVDGTYTLTGVPTGAKALTVRRVGYQPDRVAISVSLSGATQNFTLRSVPTTLNEVVVTALGETTQQRSLGTAQQTVSGSEIAQTQRENFINSLQGRVAGVQVISSSGVPGASSQIIIRGVSSISSSNQPLMIVDGLPLDNKTINTNNLASALSTATDVANRGVDFTNRSSDLNPEDIESLVVLKGPEASALYGIDAANGAIVITTKRGKVGKGGLEYSNSFRIESVRGAPEIQRVYGPSSVGTATFNYFGAPYPKDTTFYDNVAGFFQTAMSRKHNLAFSGASTENRLNYRLSTSLTDQVGVIPNTLYNRLNVTGASQAQVTKSLAADFSLSYAYARNRQPMKGGAVSGDPGPLVGLLAWPITDDAKQFLTASGTRRKLLSGSGEIDNPYFSINKNQLTSRNNRFITNIGLKYSPVTWANLKTNIGADTYTNQNLMVRHPESRLGNASNGILESVDDITRNISAQTVLSFTPQRTFMGLTFRGLVGHSVAEFKNTLDDILGTNFLEPDFVSSNNTATRTSRTVGTQRRLMSGFGSATVGFRDYLYITATGRNDWTSTIPKENNSFFYPSLSGSFVFTDAFPALGKHMSGKLRAAYAEVGRDAPPYAYRTALEYKTSSYGGYGYTFWGPNPALQPEFAIAREGGTELSFLDNRLGLDFTAYRKETRNQIVVNIRGSYATGFVLFNLNGASTRNTGTEITLRGTPIQNNGFSWDFIANFDKSHGKTIGLPFALPESYLSDTWLYGNVRNGTQPGISTMSLTGMYYQRNNKGELLIDPTTGLPMQSTSFIDRGYDRQPKYSLGITNTFKRGPFTLSALTDIRHGGDVFNATEHYLTIRGLSKSTLNRNDPITIPGVLKDGKENSATPTKNTIVIVPAVNTSYYTNMSEELFIEKNINWFRLRDVTLQYVLPSRLMSNASVFITGTDLYMKTNYTGLDPIVNGHTAAVGGSGAVGIDFGNFPMPRGLNFGLRLTR